MKQIITIFVLTAMSLPLFSQGAKKFVLLEHLTNSECSICASRNPALFSLIENYPDDVHHMAIHPSVPYPSCVFYNANQADNNARKDYYNIFGTPQLFMLGTKANSGSTLLSEADLQAQLGQTSPLQILVDETTGNDTRDVTVTVNSLETAPTGDLRLFVAVLEKEINQTTGNGESVHHNVLRDFISENTGDPVTPSAPGGSVTFNYNYSIDANWNADEIYVLAFVQIFDTKEVINSGSSLDPVIPSSVKNNNFNELGLTLMPNPAKDKVNIQFNEEVSGKTTVTIFNLLGQQVFFKEVINTQIELNLNLNKGIYLVQVENGAKKSIKKLMLN